MAFDKERLIEDADIFAVADALGIETKQIGGRTSILCPCHGDRNFGNCIIKDGYYKCFACGASGNAVDLAMHSLGVGFVEACKIVAETCGGYEHYIVKRAYGAGQAKPIKRKEAELIGLFPKCGFALQKITGDPDEAEEGVLAGLACY
jgi:DNA primase